MRRRSHPPAPSSPGHRGLYASTVLATAVVLLWLVPVVWPDTRQSPTPFTGWRGALNVTASLLLLAAIGLLSRHVWRLCKSGRRAPAPQRHTRSAARPKAIHLLTPLRPARPKRLAHPDADGLWSPDVFAAIEWQRFVAVCHRLLEQSGFTLHAAAPTKKMGDTAGETGALWLCVRQACRFKHQSNHPSTRLVQCQHNGGQALGVAPLQAFLQQVRAQGLQRGTYVTSGHCSAKARGFAQAHGIYLLDSAGVLELIRRGSTEQQRELLALAFEGEYWRPSCVRCGIKMVEHPATPQHNAYWACADAPRCGQRIPIQAPA